MATGPQLVMVLIDSSVWIDFFSARALPHVVAMESIIEHREDICICGIILAEVLQGIGNDSEFRFCTMIKILSPLRNTAA